MWLAVFACPLTTGRWRAYKQDLTLKLDGSGVTADGVREVFAADHCLNEGGPFPDLVRLYLGQVRRAPPVAGRGSGGRG